MMTQTLQGIQRQHAPTGYPIQTKYTQSPAQILQLDNMDSDNPVRFMIQQRISKCLKERVECYNWNPHCLAELSKQIDDQLYKDASKESVESTHPGFVMSQNHTCFCKEELEFLI